MANESRERKKEETQRQERAQRILDTALTLTLRWGYNKTTIDDISRQAGVAKGTIYLHWKTREELFEALIKRERAAVGRDIQKRIAQDPEGWTLRGIVKHSALATMKRPLIKALFMSDRDVLGKLANNEMSSEAFAERLAGFKAYLEILRQRGLVRTDLSLEQQVQIWSAALAGFFFAAPFMPPEFRLTDEQMADLMADTVHRTLETDRLVAPDEYKALADFFSQYMERTTTSAEDQFLDEIKDT